MTLKVPAVLAALVLTAQSALALEADRKDLRIFNDISKSVNRYAYFTIFDDVSARIDNGVVTLEGEVTMPYKRSEMEKRVAKIDGVERVVNRIGILPVSTFDDQLRHRLARVIYGNQSFWNYAIMPNPPIHIIVKHGRVRLTGVVQNEMDRMLVRSLAAVPGVMSVKNELRTDAEARSQLERL